MTSAPSGYRASNSTAEKALRVMSLFAPYRKTLTALIVADELDVARSTAYRYLESLEAQGFLTPGPDGFEIGPRILQLAELARDDGVRELAKTCLIELRDRFDETAILTYRHDLTSTIIEEVVSSQRLTRVFYERGSIMPVHAGAPSLVLLCGASDAELSELYTAAHGARFTEQSITSLEELITTVREIERSGYSITHGQLNTEAVSVAVPIFSRTGILLGALAICPVASRSTPELEQQMVDALMASAASLQLSLAQ